MVQAFLLAAMKVHCYVRALPLAAQPDSSSTAIVLLNAVEGVSGGSQCFSMLSVVMSTVGVGIPLGSYEVPLLRESLTSGSTGRLRLGLAGHSAWH